MKGLLIVFEGLDCSGKTTAINKIIKNNNIYSNNKKLIYSKGIGSNILIGKISRKIHTTLIFFIELTYFIYTKIKPNIKKGKIILQDRYDISITSYIPLTNKSYNKFIIMIFKYFIIRPDAIVYFHLPLKERIKRLKEKGTMYELMLANNPQLINLREEKYIEWYNYFNGPKIKINTKENNISQTVKILENFIKSLPKNLH